MVQNCLLSSVASLVVAVSLENRLDFPFVCGQRVSVTDIMSIEFPFEPLELLHLSLHKPYKSECVCGMKIKGFLLARSFRKHCGTTMSRQSQRQEGFRNKACFPVNASELILHPLMWTCV